VEHTADVAMFLQSIPVFDQLSLTVCQALLQQSVIERFEKRQTLQRSGEPHHHLYVVITGKLEMVATSTAGEEMTIAVLGPKSMSSWVALYLEGGAHRDLIAAPDTRVLAIPAQVLRQFLIKQPELYPLVLQYEGRRFRAALDLTQLVLNPKRTHRLATHLLMLVEISGDISERPKILLTHQQLQKVANCSRQVLHQSLKILQGIGVIRQAYGYIEVLDKEGLKSYSTA
jgi:CRP/FNR family transcriptional regulator, cyclic AMP receptor protein